MILPSSARTTKFNAEASMSSQKIVALSILMVFAAGLPALAHNCTVDTFPFWDGNITKGWTQTAQIIQPPPSCNKLVEYQFELAARDSPGEVQFSIYEWGPDGPVGNALYTTTLPWDTSASIIVVSNINTVLERGKLYGAVVDLLGYSSQSVYFQENHDGYSRGSAAWYDGPWVTYDGFNHRFRAKWAKP